MIAARREGEPVWNHEFHAANGIQIHVVRHGRGLPLIFIHGWPEYWRVWWKVIEPLSMDHEVIAMDFRGCGATEKPAVDDISRYALSEYVADIIGLADALGHERFGIVCHGVGAYHAQGVARARPDRLIGLFAFDCPYPGIGKRWGDPRSMLETWYQYFNQMPWAAEMIGSSRRACELYLRKFLDYHAARPGLFDKEIEEWIDVFLAPGNLEGGLNWYRSLQPMRLALMLQGAPKLTPISVPTCVRWGEHDSIIRPEFADRLPEYFSALDFEVAPGGHFVAYEEPAYAVAEIRRFFARFGQPSSH
jgi:pimeloyl-ACP methyl ester carboxylesterase